MEQRTHTPTQPPSPREPVWGPDAVRLRDELRALLAHDAATEPWPDGVTHRYRTPVGSHVDIRGGGDRTAYKCTGCPYSSGGLIWHESIAHEHAQHHAERCRALPRPEAS
ncbi:hypothetical protein GCM10018980_51570 [Streptomyces capoamus]|uniref:Uncharacterized protein n=1 Tax=Streptomyces capoamus TaxID=68183 RepID=A0A919KDC7_9ACTN|nr:hypothetical protein [Streptomyces capoamus]GGW15785.1 hypothetical protein GCM10010501_29240 [Streptomyces libani subsp. rufus]GHG61996.1 hypothetical protein GCM10018980_51570 [Streptomyces capoamus]